MNTIKSFILPLFVGITYFFLYIPIFVLITFSFNNNALTYNWTGFTTQWYEELFLSVEAWQALSNSLIVSFSSVLLSLILGSLFIFFIPRSSIKKMHLFFYGSLAIPEIVLAIGLLSLFSFLKIPLGITTLIAGHTLLGLGYVIPILHDRFMEIDKGLIEAAYDLGATKEQAFISIILPLLGPGLIAAGLLVFIISLDDFIISFFCSGASVQTLPLYIFAVIRTGASPMINALSTILLFTSSLFVILFSLLHVKKVGIKE